MKFLVKKEVKKALEKGLGVVALESTIITHGMPRPENWETALAVENVVREEGAVPATIAVMGGEVKIGLEEAQLKELAKFKSPRKISRQDLAFAVSKGLTGGTTVAATMLLAQRAGIGVFATGGIGGVHRGVENTFDISADLEELARTRVAVFCAGVKSILDIRKTLEYLETKGVPVIGYQTDHFPAFFSDQSGFFAPMRLDGPGEIASFIKHKKELDLGGGIVIACPVPKGYGISKEEMEKALEFSLKEAEERGIAGKGVTPFLLKRMNEHTRGNTLRANKVLIKNNASIGAQVSKFLV